MAPLTGELSAKQTEGVHLAAERLRILGGCATQNAPPCPLRGTSPEGGSEFSSAPHEVSCCHTNPLAPPPGELAPQATEGVHLAAERLRILGGCATEMHPLCHLAVALPTQGSVSLISQSPAAPYEISSLATPEGEARS